MRPAVIMISVLLVLTGCMAGVDPAPQSAAELRAAVGRSAHVVRETHVVERSRQSVAATLAARANRCLAGAWMTEERGRIALTAATGAERTAPILVADLSEAGPGRTRVTLTRSRDVAGPEAAAVLAWAGGDTRPCPGRPG